MRQGVATREARRSPKKKKRKKKKRKDKRSPDTSERRFAAGRERCRFHFRFLRVTYTSSLSVNIAGRERERESEKRILRAPAGLDQSIFTPSGSIFDRLGVLDPSSSPPSFDSPRGFSMRGRTHGVAGSSDLPGRRSRRSGNVNSLSLVLELRNIASPDRKQRRNIDTAYLRGLTNRNDRV